MRFRLVTILLYASIAYAQQENSGPATSHAKCSPPVTGTKNTVIVHCNDLQSREDIKKLLQMIHDSGASTQQILKKLDQMAEEMKGRHLTADQIRSFSELLKPMAGSTVAISCNQSSDSCLLADDLATVFNNAAWFDYDDLPENGPPGHRETIRARTNHTAGNDFVGMRVQVSAKALEKQPASQTIQAFLAALSAAHFLTSDPTIDSSGLSSSTVLMIWIGTKPR